MVLGCASQPKALVEPRPKSPSDHFSNDVCHELRAMCLP